MLSGGRAFSSDLFRSQGCTLSPGYAQEFISQLVCTGFLSQLPFSTFLIGGWRCDGVAPGFHPGCCRRRCGASGTCGRCLCSGTAGAARACRWSRRKANVNSGRPGSRVYRASGIPGLGPGRPSDPRIASDRASFSIVAPRLCWPGFWCIRQSHIRRFIKRFRSHCRARRTPGCSRVAGKPGSRVLC